MEEHQAAASVPPPAAQASAGLADNVAGALAYVTVLPAILFLVLEPYNKRPFVRFNALQSLGIAICGFVGSIVIQFFLIIPILGWFYCSSAAGPVPVHRCDPMRGEGVWRFTVQAAYHRELCREPG